MLGKGNDIETECKVFPSADSINSAFPRYKRMTAFLALQTLIGS